MPGSSYDKTTEYDSAETSGIEAEVQELEGATELSIPRDRRFGRYELLMEMAKGGMATLFLARISGPEGFEKLVALKRVHDQLGDEEQFVQMFLDEARISARIHHPNVASVFDMGEVDGSYYIAMEYVHGQNLNDVLRAAVRLPETLSTYHAMRIVADTAAGLHAAHEIQGPDGKPLGVVHRDVSPQNILVSYDGNIKVVDFGIAYAAERVTSTATGTMKGKAAYMSPEQVMGETVDRRADIFALGIVLWESVLKRRLFREDTAATSMMRIRDGDIRRPRTIHRELPSSIDEIIMKALAHKPEDRYQTMAEFEDALNRELVRRDQYVAHGQISSLMETLFHDRRSIKDEQIQLALKAKPTKPIIAVGMGRRENDSSTALSFSSSIQARPLRRVSLIAGLIVVALVGVGLVFLATRGGGDSPGDSARGGAAPRSASAVQDAVAASPMRVNKSLPAQVQVRIDVSPANCRPVILFRDKRYTGSKNTITTHRTQTPVTARVTAAGYHPKQLRVDLRRDSQILVEMRPLQIAGSMAPPRRRRRPRRPGTRRPPRRRSSADLVKRF
jgi:eukaryotic-like serine/threonine-protein kinase